MHDKNIDFICVGGAHIDYKACASATPMLGESNAVELSMCVGGVACNVAHNLSILKARVSLCSIIGDDAYGRFLLSTLEKSGIDCRDIAMSKDQPTASYYAILCEKGELFIAAAATRIYDDLSPALLKPLLKRYSAISHWVLDANLSDESIKAICSWLSPSQNLWGVGVSSGKASRLAAGFPYWRGLFLNTQELEALSGMKDIERGMHMVHEEGCRMLIITAGKEGVYYSSGLGIKRALVRANAVVDVTGAGDALCAATLYGIFNQESLDDAVRLGLQAAACAISSRYSSVIG